MSAMPHPLDLLTEEHLEIAGRYLRYDYGRKPDKRIGTPGGVYLYRWHVIPRNPDANVYFHIQVASDPDRPLHDHPWDNYSVLLGNAYQEAVRDGKATVIHKRKEGQVIRRYAQDAHRLILPPEVPYVMTQFVTGPAVRLWGFWTEDGWKPWTECITERDGVSTWIKE